MPYKKFLLLFIIPVFALNSITGQSYFFRKYQVENGLSNNATISCLQDHKGFMWFGTKDGLNRFDGYTFKIFRNDPDVAGSIGNNFIHSLYEDQAGVLWIGTESGLYQYDATTENFTLLQESANARIRDIKSDKAGNLWFIVGFTLCKYNLHKKNAELYNSSRFFESTSICTAADGTLWASGSNGNLYKYNAVRDSFTAFNLFQHSPSPASKWIEKIYYTTKGNILAGTSNQGAKLFNIKSCSYTDILTYNADKTEIFVRNFVQTAENEFWIATETGIFIYNMNTGSSVNLSKKINDPYSISDNAVYSFCRDSEGGIWACTYFGGVNYYPKQHTPFKKYFPMTNENSLSGNVVREIHKDNNGNLWIGTEDAGLNKLETATGKFTRFLPTGNSSGISYTNIHGLLVNGNELWIGTFEHGLDIMDIQTGKVIRHYAMGTANNALKSNFIYCINRLDNGEIILGTTRGAYLFNRQSNDFSLLPGMPLNIWYTCIMKDSKGIIWAGTYGNGVNFYNTGTKQNGSFKYDATNKTSIGSDRVNSIFEDSKHNLWFGTEGGLCRYNRKQNNFKRYTSKEGFPGNFIISMLEDEQKNLWISTSKGLICFNPATEKTTVYTTVNGTLNDQFNFNSAYRDQDGTMYFGSVKGLISFHPSAFIKNVFIPPVYITGFQVFNKDLTIGEKDSPLKNSIIYTNKITLVHDQSTINIGFATLSYTAPEMSEYAFKMEGLDKNWTYLKRNRNAYFTGLSPGSYTFKVKASNSSGIWNEKETKLVIEILPPWWSSTWAYAVYTLLAILIIYYSFRVYHKRNEEKNRRKFELLERLKEKEVFQAKLEFFTNVAHEIKTPLTLIKAPLEKVMKKADGNPDLVKNLTIMDRNTNRLIDLTNQLLDFRQTEIKGFSLNFSEANISELLEDTYQSFKPLAEQKNIGFYLGLPAKELWASIDFDAFNKILNNLFSNAIKYAKNEVFIKLLPFNVRQNYFVIEVKNDGFLIPPDMKKKIFEPFFRLKETEKQKGTGIGLAISQSLTELHKGKLDLKDQEGGYNVFWLTLPIYQKSELYFHTITANVDETTK